MKGWLDDHDFALGKGHGKKMTITCSLMKEERKIQVMHNNLWEKVLRKNGKLIRKYLEVKVEVTEDARKVVENVGKVLLKHWESMNMLAV